MREADFATLHSLKEAQPSQWGLDQKGPLCGMTVGWKTTKQMRCNMKWTKYPMVIWGPNGIWIKPFMSTPLSHSTIANPLDSSSGARTSDPIQQLATHCSGTRHRAQESNNQANSQTDKHIHTNKQTQAHRQTNRRANSQPRDKHTAS